MRKSNTGKTNELLRQIEMVERGRAARIMRELREPPLATKVNDLRQKYIVSGFLYPLYSWDKRYSRPLHRVEKLGNFVQSKEAAGERFGEGRGEWVVQEEYLFWEYLVHGQDAILLHPSHELPAMHFIKGAPARVIRQRIYGLIRELGLHGHAGGGIYSSREYLEEGYLASAAPLTGTQGNEAIDRGSDSSTGEPRWLGLMKDYRDFHSPVPFFEIRPAWFHLANYIFFDVPIIRLPVFAVLFNRSGNVTQLTFLEDSLTREIRSVTGKLWLRLPELMKDSKARSIALLHRNMTWWLWNNMGDAKKGKRLGYGEIARSSGYTKANIQVSIGAIDQITRRGMTNEFLSHLMHAATSIGLEPNLVYDYLAKENLVPHRERPIDGFDDLSKLL